MPGMMDTILNLGLADAAVDGLAEESGNKRFALDSYRRFIQMYGTTAKDIDRTNFDEAFDRVKNERTRPRLSRPDDQKILDTDVNADELTMVVGLFKDVYHSATGTKFPQPPFDQLTGAVNAVFSSFNSEKAITYRRVENITSLKGTAVNVQQMVFGNLGDDSGTGVCFTRDPSTGENTFYGDLLINAQGEDVVAGVRTPMHLDELKSLMPDIYDQLQAVRIMLECHHKEMQDLEFTIERGKLYVLQCRTGKRSPVAVFKIAVDQATRAMVSKSVTSRLVKKKVLPARFASLACKPVISRAEAIERITVEDIERLFYPVIDPAIATADLEASRMCQGINAVPGAACGEVVFTAEDAQNRAASGASVILVRKETSPEDVGGMHAAAGILTATGGKTSHAAVVARGWGKCCIVGCEELHISAHDKTLSVNGQTLGDGDWLTLDGSSGGVYHGQLKLARPTAPPQFDTLMKWCDKIRRMKVRANADTPADAAKALEFGAQGIGLCRTEHMFFDPAQPQRLRAMREMILAETEPERRRALDKLLPFQRKDFEGIFEVMNGKPVTIRLLDPPLHEFLPKHDNPKAQLSCVEDLNAGSNGSPITIQDIQRRINQLHESNPMLGHRGCRLCISYPEILEMQVRAIIEAAVHCKQRRIKVEPEIMIPLVMDAKELQILTDRVHAVAAAVLSEKGAKLKYMVGTMIELPRAALLANEIAGVAEFFSFGTNDLTQTAMGLSRDDAGRFLPDYVDQDKSAIFPADPFQTIDVAGVGLLVKMASKRGRATRPELKLGICGEHGGDPQSIRFFHSIGLDYVSCSPYRVPGARLAAAQATIESPKRR